MNIACWNVRTLLDDKNNCRPERRTALVACELKRYNIDIAALAETHKEGDGQLEEVGGGYTFFLEGKAEGGAQGGGCRICNPVQHSEEAEGASRPYK